MNQLSGQMSSSYENLNKTLSVSESTRLSQSQTDQENSTSTKPSINSEKIIHGYKKRLHNRIRMTMKSEQPSSTSLFSYVGCNSSRSNSSSSCSNRSSPGREDLNSKKLLNKQHHSPSRSHSSFSLFTEIDEKKYMNGIGGESKNMVSLIKNCLFFKDDNKYWIASNISSI